MERIDRLHGIQVCTEFNQKAAPHPIAHESLKLDVVSGLANSSAHLPHTTTLWTFSFGLHWSKIQLHILVAISFKMKVIFGIPLVYLNMNYFCAYFFIKSLCLHFLSMKIFEIFLLQTFHK